MPTRYNVSHLHVVPTHIERDANGELVFDEIEDEQHNVTREYHLTQAHHLGAVAPGEGHEFTDEEIEQGAANGVEWSDTDPRRGLAAERTFKTKRDKPQDATNPDDSAESSEQPAEPETKE